MAAKRKRRAGATQKKRAAVERAKAEWPPSKLDLHNNNAGPSVPSSSSQSSSEQQPQEEREPTQRAKALVAAQQESVKMLTHVTQRIQSAIDVESLARDFATRGYHVVDDFLDDPEVVNTLQRECEALYSTHNDMTVDLQPGSTSSGGGLGTGEFGAALQGGEDQYPKCPRSIELIVSLTSKLSPKINVHENLRLDERACSGALARIFDRSALRASLKLLLGDDGTEDRVLDEPPMTPPPPFRTVVEINKDDDDATAKKPQEDLKKVSICYFAVPTSWDDSCGGGLTFSNNNNNSVHDDDYDDNNGDSGHRVEAKRDRMVLWKSDTTRYRREPFRGRDDVPLASWLELHLIQQQQ